jgi:hypothetical protein
VREGAGGGEGMTLQDLVNLTEDNTYLSIREQYSAFRWKNDDGEYEVRMIPGEKYFEGEDFPNGVEPETVCGTLFAGDVWEVPIRIGDRKIKAITVRREEYRLKYHNRKGERIVLDILVHDN